MGRPDHEAKNDAFWSPGTSHDEHVEAQINIKGSARDIERFRRIAKRDGLRLIGLLRRATEAYEREGSLRRPAREPEPPVSLQT